MEDNTGVCPKCNGVGYIFYDENGYQIARECECQELIKAKARLKASGISDEFLKKGFKNFNDRNLPVLKKAKEIGLDYCKQFPSIRHERRNSVLYQGQVGSGKTHLSMAICNNIMEFHKVGVVYMPYREEITRIKQTVTDEINYNNAIGRFKNAPVLMIDDLLKGKNSEADVNILFEIINFRYLNNMPMVISTEKTIDELLSFDEGTMSRVIEMARGHQIEILGREYNYRLYGD
jgi:DNA replication protein DnaC